MAYSIEKSHISEDEPKVLSLQLLKEVTNDFSEERKLGSGTYGDVYKGVLNGEEIAVKVLRLIPRDDFHEQFKREFENLWRLKHRNIVRLLGYCYETKTQYVDFGHGAYVFADKVDIALCFEYMHNRSLGEHLYDEYNGHDWQTRYKIIKGICEGLKYLHEGLERPMYHLDLKPENILLDKTMLPKIADFGLSRLVHNDQTKATRSSAGTSGYMPPEYIHTNLISKKFDIFSLGVVVIRIIVGYKGYFKKADLSSQEFINLACENWRKRLQETSSRTMVEAQCHQVKRCIEIALDCVDADRNKRPPIGYIVRNLKELEPMIDTTAMSQMQRISITEEPGDNSTEGLQALSLNSSSRKFSSLTVPEKLPSSSSGKPPLDLVIVYAFDCFHQKTTTFYTVDDGVFWMVHEKLTHFVNSCMGYICLQLTNNMYWSDMKLVNSAETRETGYNHITERLITCTKNMACGLPEAHKMISNRGYQNGIILLFSDGMIHEGDFFDGAENFISNVPVHTFTLGGDAYNHVLQAMAENSPGGTFNPLPVPERPQLSESFSSLMDKILWDTMALSLNRCSRKFSSLLPVPDKLPISSSGKPPLDLVIVYAFDCLHQKNTTFYTVDDGVFWMVHEKLTHFVDSCMGYICIQLTNNMYWSDMKLVDSAETRETGYNHITERLITCTKNMACGLPEAHKMISNRGYQNGIILLFSDGLIHKGDFFDGAENFVSNVPVHTFTLGGDAYNHVLQAMSKNSPGGTFNPLPVPERPQLSKSFSRLLDKILTGTMAG